MADEKARMCAEDLGRLIAHQASVLDWQGIEVTVATPRGSETFVVTGDDDPERDVSYSELPGTDGRPGLTFREWAGEQRREFPLDELLTITTGKLVARRHMDAVYDVLDFIVGLPLMTHMLPRASEEWGRPTILAQHPDLAEIKPEDVPPDEERIWLWLEEMEAKYGKARTLTPFVPCETIGGMDDPTDGRGEVS